MNHRSPQWGDERSDREVTASEILRGGMCVDGIRVSVPKSIPQLGFVGLPLFYNINNI